ncbi:hypothetical protein [Anaeromyxobacter sp. SG26]|uniref:hypothetical protein n=2 Tax=Anaeromyxobacteraceae TaxID=1524215 RepID=UPI001F55BEB1|nr:hypothetical protein [Anaeromyxobacter sp. SG26]
MGNGGIESMHVGDDNVGLVAEFKRRKGPAWRRALDLALEASRRRAAARAAAKMPKPLPDVKVSRSRLDVAVEARLAVRSGVRLEDFLRNRLAKYASRLPVTLEDLPVVVDVEGGEPVVRARVHAAPAIPATYGASYAASYAAQPRTDDQTRWMKALVEREGPFAAQEIREALAALAALDARAEAARSRADTLARALADDLAAGKVPAPATVDATPEQLGRPPVPSPAPAAILRGFVLALVVAEAFFFSGPILSAQGVDPASIVEALNASPVPVGMALVFALGAAAAVFAFAAVSLDRAAQLDRPDGASRRGLGGTAALLAALLAGGVAAAATAPNRLAHVALLAIVPFAGALLVRVAARLQATRDAALDAALAWDRALARDVSERARRVEIVEQARADLERIESDRADARRRIRALEQSAVNAERASSERSRLEARRLERLAESLAGALELDRYAFLRLATGATHDALVRPVRRLERSSERFGVAG